MVAGSSATVETPAGPFSIVAGDDGAVLASGWTAEATELIPSITPGLRPASLRRRDDLGPIIDAVRDYVLGELTAIDEVAVRYMAGAFLDRAWLALRGIPAGQPITYAELATRCGMSGMDGARAAGSACAANPAALFVPCHRVIGSDGSLRGFGWGLDVKRWLLDHEAGVAALPLA